MLEEPAGATDLETLSQVRVVDGRFGPREFLLIIGIIMIFTPGPAIVFIPAGLALLATEFQWARRLLHRVRPLIDAAIEKAKQKKEAIAKRRADKQAARRQSHPAEESHPADVTR